MCHMVRKGEQPKNGRIVQSILLLEHRNMGVNCLLHKAKVWWTLKNYALSQSEAEDSHIMYAYIMYDSMYAATCIACLPTYGCGMWIHLFIMTILTVMVMVPWLNCQSQMKSKWLMQRISRKKRMPLQSRLSTPRLCKTPKTLSFKNT